MIYINFGHRGFYHLFTHTQKSTQRHQTSCMTYRKDQTLSSARHMRTHNAEQQQPWKKPVSAVIATAFRISATPRIPPWLPAAHTNIQLQRPQRHVIRTADRGRSESSGCSGGTFHTWQLRNAGVLVRKRAQLHTHKSHTHFVHHEEGQPQRTAVLGPGWLRRFIPESGACAGLLVYLTLHSFT